MKFGYARVSTQDQNLEMQTDALLAAGCDRIFEEKASGAKRDRPELNALLDQLRDGDVLVVWKLDRLARSMKHLIELVGRLDALGVGFVSVQDGIDTSTPAGRFMFHIMGSLAEFERDVIRERTKAGLEAARARGRKGGRPKGLTADAQLKARAVQSLSKDKNLGVGAICSQLGISRATYYNYLKVKL